MNRIKQEEAAPQAEPRAKKGKISRAITGLLSGDFLTRKEVVEHIPYALYITSFFLLTIYLGYSFDNTEREKLKVKQSLKEKNAEYKTLKTQLEARRQLSQLAGEITSLGLEEPSNPPVVIEISRKELEEQK